MSRDKVTSGEVSRVRDTSGLFLTVLMLLLGNVMPFSDDSQPRSYVRDGDLVLGAVLPVHVFDSAYPCGFRLRDISAVQTVEALVYTIDQINNSTDLLPGVQLGFAILDDCAKDTTALQETLKFMPESQRYNSKQCEMSCSNKKDDEFYDVIGVIGAESTPSTIMIANLLNIFQIPQISPSASSDLLTDKKYRYLMRMVPPDSFQVEAILDILKHFNWTYISVAYSEGGYGTKAAENLKQSSGSLGICIGEMVRVSPSDNEQMFDAAVQTLNLSKARVVVLFADQEELKYLFRAVQRAKLLNRFVWIGSDGVAVNIDDLQDFSDVALGALTVSPHTVFVPEFQEHFEKLNPHNTNGNPWISEMWEFVFNCTWSLNETNEECYKYDSIRNSSMYEPSSFVSIFIDTVHVFARALDSYIDSECSNMPTSALRSCIKGDQYLNYMKQVDFEGKIGNIKLEPEGDFLIGEYKILNVRPDGSSGQNRMKSHKVGRWDARKSELYVKDTEIYWGLPQEHGQVPESWCGQKCVAGEIYFYHKGTCCWECRRCKSNEITTTNDTKCTDCPLFSWPNQDTFRTCHAIPPEYLFWADPLVIIMIVAALTGLGGCLAMLIIYMRHNKARVIKATSRELSYIILFGVLVQFTLVCSLVSIPSTVSCFINLVGFNLSFTLVYAPLMVKTNRIYRIFDAGRRTIRLPSCTSPCAQVAITCLFIGVQVRVCQLKRFLFVLNSASINILLYSSKFSNVPFSYMMFFSQTHKLKYF